MGSRHIAQGAMLLLMAMIVPGADALCRTPPKGATLNEPAVTVWGQETIIAFGSGFRDYQGAKPGVEGPWLAPVITAIVLALMSLYLLLTAPRKAPPLYWAIVSYPLFTALVELARVNFDASRYGFLTASWHNLPEYIIICHLFLNKRRAILAIPLCFIWIWFVDVVIMFVPSLDGIHRGPMFAGLAEQLTGICCDHLLIWVFLYLYATTDKAAPESDGKPGLKETYWYGLCGAFWHMLEIVPLVVLLSGLAPRPFIPICVLVALTQPITFYYYSLFAKEWCVNAVAATNAKRKIPHDHAILLLIVGISTGLVNILGPMAIPACPVIPTPASAVPSVHVPAVNASSGLMATPTVALGPAPLLCVSKIKQTGTTTVVAKPGKGQRLVDMVATMPGPIRREDGCIYYEEAFGQNKEGKSVVKFFESWSSITTLYTHIYLSKTVASVFKTAEFNTEVVESQLLEGPFHSLVPCEEVQKESEPLVINFEITLDAPIDCVWAKLDNWCGDVSWVPRVQGVTCKNPFLRVMHFNTTDIMEIRQAPPLPPPEQPANGHRLIYYLLSGGFLKAFNLEVYKGDVTLLPHPKDPVAKTVYKYTITIVPKDSSKLQTIYDKVVTQYQTDLLPKLQKWAKYNSACNCNKELTREKDLAAQAATTYSIGNPVVTCSPLDDENSSEYYMMFEVDNSTKAILPDNAHAMLRLVLGKNPDDLGCLDAEVLYAAKVGVRILHQKGTTVQGPYVKDKKPWDIVIVLRLHNDIDPASVGAHIAVRNYFFQVSTQPIPDEGLAAACKDTQEWEEATKAIRGDIKARLERFEGGLQAMLDTQGSDPEQPESYRAPRSGVNLLKFKTSIGGVHGSVCYNKYLYMIHKLISCYGRNGRGGVAYWGTVVHDPNTPAEQQWDAVVIPIYASGEAFFQVMTHPQALEDLVTRDATLVDDVSIDVGMLPGSTFQAP